MRQGKGVVSSFRSVMENSWSWIFLHVGAYKSGGCSLLMVCAREIRE
jgi:hypothetical protein